MLLLEVEFYTAALMLTQPILTFQTYTAALKTLTEAVMALRVSVQYSTQKYDRPIQRGSFRQLCWISSSHARVDERAEIE